MTNSPSLILSILKKIILESGNLLKELANQKMFKGKYIESHFKADADLIIHNKIKSLLEESYPSIPVVSEEDPESWTIKNSEYFLIDPIDGTSSFINGFDGWVTQIAYMKNYTPIVSVIFCPKLNLLYSSIKEKGAYLNGAKLKVSKMSKLVSIIDNYPKPIPFIKKIMSELCIRKYIECGSISLKTCMVADNSCTLFVKDMNPKAWDLASPYLILKEAGGFLSDMHGKKICFNSPNESYSGLIATTSISSIKKVSEAIKSINIRN